MYTVLLIVCIALFSLFFFALYMDSKRKSGEGFGWFNTAFYAFWAAMVVGVLDIIAAGAVS